MRAAWQWFSRSLAAQLVLAVLVIAAVTLLFDSHRSPAYWAVRTVLYGAVGAAFVLHSRRKETARTGSDPRAAKVLSRKIMHGTVPRDPGEQDAMRRLVTYRLHLMRRTRWAVPVMGVGIVLLLALAAATGQWAVGAFVVFGAAGVGVALWTRRRATRKLHRMDDALGRGRHALEH
ncbi:hypothetical protein [Streptomyces beijiangensis]|uniref:Transmembrane protein n=1 Tax=Streptomyces beijiangensis TaxID=163361 RepID=A0A939JGM8_9ACTN|nr:hypothetical protein [Streptomyces beijiangensis]MBO0513588.1 hypothetical protein [Streptomyces beijiangensis]